METIATPMDFLGINYYSPIHVEADPSNAFFGVKTFSEANPYSQLFTCDPKAFGKLLEQVWKQL